MIKSLTLCLWLTSSAAFSASLSARALRGLPTSPSAGEVVSAVLTDAASVSARRLLEAFPGIEDYLRIESDPTDSLHDFYDDTRLVLQVPQGRANVWFSLDEPTRLATVRLFESIMNAAPFEHRKRIEAIRYFPWIGIAPELLLLAAAGHNASGVCRHRNVALAGLLLELGAPSSEVRVMAARAHEHDPGSHLWTEFRTSEKSPWYELDGSGAGLGNGRDRALFPAIISTQCPPPSAQPFRRYRWRECTGDERHP